ncbi:glycosyltransferase family 4 protein [bacterium]|nr:glycosyltransferase family 4 protein [bacterium]
MSENRVGTLPGRIAFYTDARAWGGAEVYMTQVALGLKRAGFDPRLLVADRREVDEWVEHLREQGLDVKRFPPGKEFNPRVFFDGLRLLRGFEIVHFNKTHPRNCLPAVWAARLAGASVVVATEHIARSPDSNVLFGRRIITALVRLTNRLIDMTIAVSELSREILIRNYGIPKEKIVEVKNGIDLSQFDTVFDASAVRADLGLGVSDPVAVLVGRMADGKGHVFALRAIEEIRKRIPDYRLVFVGEGGIEEKLRAEAESLGLTTEVIWAGFRRDVPAILASADLLILPSEGESLPFVILEAMGSRLPVVASDVGGISEQIEDGVTGRLIRPRDAAGLAEAIIDVLSRPDRGRSLGEAGRRKLEAEFSIEASVGRVLEIYGDTYASQGHRR